MSKNYYYRQDGVKEELCRADFLYISDVKQFYEDADEDLITDGIGKEGVYHWNGNDERWDRVVENTWSYNKVIEWVELEPKEQTETAATSGDSWNIDVWIEEGVIRTNDVPVSMSEVQEAITVMLKPSFFGKRIKKIEIVRATEIDGIKRE